MTTSSRSAAGARLLRTRSVQAIETGSESLRDVEELLGRTGTAATVTSQADQQILASGRDLRSSAEPLVLPVSGDRFGRCHH
jgi:hypothetical protein